MHTAPHHRPAVLTLALWLATLATAATGPYQATGFKVGEVTPTTAIVWTRLTRRPRPNPADGPMVSFRQAEADASRTASRKRAAVVGVIYAKGTTVADLRHAAPGAPGEVRVSYRPAATSAWRHTSWTAVDPSRDFTHPFTLDGLRPNTRYELRVAARTEPNAPLGQVRSGGFRTAPQADDANTRVVFTVSTGQAFGDQDRPDGYHIYPAMLTLDPSFFVHTGDIVYYDKLAKTLPLARYHWQRTYSRPTNVDFHERVASYFIKDDHDTLCNDCWPGMTAPSMYRFTFAQGQAVFREQVPMGPRTYRTFRWGRDLQIWLVEGRDFRSPNTQTDGPDKTIWGAVQKAWFKRTVQASNAAFRILISPTPLVGPDRTNKRDNHANAAFTHEGTELRRFIATQHNLVVVCGDRHWQYLSVDPNTGVREYSCGPASDQHAGGWQADDLRPAYHRYLKVVGGFLSVTVERRDGVPVATFRYHDVHGHVLFTDRRSAGS